MFNFGYTDDYEREQAYAQVAQETNADSEVAIAASLRRASSYWRENQSGGDSAEE